MQKPRVTINQVAKKAGVHASTVSRVLNSATRSMVSKPVADRVTAVAEKLGYRPNTLAAGLRSRRSRTVGVLVPDLTNPVFPAIVRAMTQALAAAGSVVVLADTNDSQENGLAIVDNLIARQVDGLILATARRTDEVVEKCLGYGTPTVLVNRITDKAAVSGVTTDDESGIRFILDHLTQLGHRRIAYVGGPQNTSTGYSRYRAFLAEMKAHKLDVDRKMVTNSSAFSELSGRESLARITQRTRLPFTAVVAANDLLALGCLDALKERGLTCPKDVSVTGFNAMPFAHRFMPSLTTVQIPMHDLGERSAQLLLERVEEPDAPPVTIRLGTRLIPGESTGPPNRI